MPWWAILYLAVLAGVSSWSLVDDARDGRSWRYLSAEAIACATWLWLFATFFLPERLTAPPLVMRTAFVAALGWSVWQGHRDIQALEPDPELSEGEDAVTNVGGIFVGVLFISPAIVYGGRAAFDTHM